MRHLSSEKYTIAWFKLADCIARGEKERALGMYRLLSHSIEDEAYVVHLEGDIFLAFNDEQGALEKYKNAADLYRKDKRLLRAAGMYNQMISLQFSHAWLNILIDLYKELALPKKVTQCLHKQLKQYIKENDLPSAVALLPDINKFGSQTDEAGAREQIVSVLLKERNKPHKVIMEHILKIIDIYSENHNNASLQTFLSKLEALDNTFYQKAIKYMQV